MKALLFEIVIVYDDILHATVKVAKLTLTKG